MKAALYLLLYLLLVPSVEAQKVTVDYDKDANFSHIRHYQWRTHPVFEKRPELKELYATGIQLVLEAGNANLMKKGLVPSDGPPDIFVTFYLAAENNQKKVTVVDYAPVGWYDWYGLPSWTHTEIDYYLTGMLVMDIVDAATDKLIWRAYCTDTIRDMRNRHENVNSAVRKALDKFPPKHK